jgi:hypothetical protein
VRTLAAIIIAVGLGACTASGGRRPHDTRHDPRTAEAGSPAEPHVDAAASRSTGTSRLPPSSLEDYLSRLQRDGLMNQGNVDDVLLARTQFIKQLDRIPPEFSGYCASTVEGKLYTTTNDSVHEVLTWLDQNSPPDRLGFFTWVNPGGKHSRHQGTERLPASGLQPYLSRLQRDGLIDQRGVDDVLLARTQFMTLLDRIPPDFSGWAASTIEGKLHTATESMGKVLTWLDQNSPPGRLGFFTWVNAAQPVDVVGETSLSR